MASETIHKRQYIYPLVKRLSHQYPSPPASCPDGRGLGPAHEDGIVVANAELGKARGGIVVAARVSLRDW
jgi:hypothetical protein